MNVHGKKRAWLIVSLLIIGAVVLLLWQCSSYRPAESAAEIASLQQEHTSELNRSSIASLRFNQTEATLVNDPTDRAELSAEALTLDDPSASDQAVATALHSLLGTLKYYNDNIYPAGFNVEWTNALLGQNPRKLGMLPMDCYRINELGEIVDRNGIPFWFHTNELGTLHIVGAGPDQTLHTADDIRFRHE